MKKRPPKCDLVGQKFGFLEVISFIGKNHRSENIWQCLCDCGNYHKAAGYQLKRLSISSCGCRKTVGAVTHGLSRTREYGIWNQMKDRCSNRNKVYYKDYGGRGIKVCDRWLDSFENFLQDMGPRPSRL
ncbi:hypothetical protein LEP3755_34020 [Leptolyngbya sp. NIES-3755]|nr:hypothetical protein LEP3755_34020 [Leptolyngbya sp. NIES-3755]